MFEMMTVAVFGIVLLLTWALCKVASNADDQLERMMEDNGESETVEQQKV